MHLWCTDSTCVIRVVQVSALEKQHGWAEPRPAGKPDKIWIEINHDQCPSVPHPTAENEPEDLRKWQGSCSPVKPLCAWQGPWYSTCQKKTGLPLVSSYTGHGSLPEIAAASGILQVARSIDTERAKVVSRPVVLTGGSYGDSRGHLAMSGDTLSCPTGGGCYWHLVARGQRCS